MCSSSSSSILLLLPEKQTCNSRHMRAGIMMGGYRPLPLCALERERDGERGGGSIYISIPEYLGDVCTMYVVRSATT